MSMRNVIPRTFMVLPAVGVAVALAIPASAAPAWVITPTVDPSPATVPFSNMFNAVAARTGGDAWAVGDFHGPNEDDGLVMLAERWNGTAWAQVATPNVVHFDEKLNAVSPAAANDVWAVGSTNRTAFAHTDPLAAHWDGASWTIVPTPMTTGGAKSILFGVANLGGGTAWAVGRSAGNRALIERWNGTAWTIVPVPDPVAPAGTTFSGSTLTGVSARAANDIWAVGTFSAAKGTTSNSFTLTVHWNGSAWAVVPSPNPATASPVNGVRQTLNGVVAIAPNDAWAVGNTVDTVSGSFLPDKATAMHWNGATWSVVPLPNLGGGSLLASVTANSPTSVWAAGNGSIVHWNGTSWGLEATPAGDPLLKGISAVPGSATEVWAAGFRLPGDGGYRTFAVHHP
jgi:hypothetical protein